MKLFDSHCHLDDSSYNKDFSQVLERAQEAGVSAIMLVGITEKNSAQLVSMAEADPRFYCSVGIHPHDASQASEQALASLKQLAGSPKVKAWGETGLDFTRMHSPQAVQERWFERQMQAAAELDLPLIFHERDSGGRFLELVTSHSKQADLRGVVHCFSGNTDEMRAYLDLGLYIGITGILTIAKRGEQLREQVISVPDDRLLIETDAPYLTPAPMKNKTRRNEPAFVRATFMKLAELRNDDPERLAEVIWQNTLNIYGIEG
jgi:TatD DNase family protein